MTLSSTAAGFSVVVPGRVNLIGEHTDYNDGLVLPMAIDRHVTLAVRPRADRLAVLTTTLDPHPATIDLDAIAPPRPGHWTNYVAGVLAGYRELGFDCPGFTADIRATLPAGGGLSSSASLEVAVATAVETLCGRSLDAVDRGLLCQRAEHEYAGVPCGIMDQFAVSLSRAGHALLLDCRSRDVEHVPLDASVRLLVVESGVKHALADGEYARRRRECAAAAEGLGVATLRDVPPAAVDGLAAALPDPLARRARHVVTEIARVPAFVAAVTARDWRRAGGLMTASHRSLAADYEVSCPELDRIVAIAGETPGVHGARLTGGGFGGSAIALVDADEAEQAGREIQRRYARATGLDTGWFVTAAAGGPRVLWD